VKNKSFGYKATTSWGQPGVVTGLKQGGKKSKGNRREKKSRFSPGLKKKSGSKGDKREANTI